MHKIEIHLKLKIVTLTEDVDAFIYLIKKVQEQSLNKGESRRVLVFLVEKKKRKTDQKPVSPGFQVLPAVEISNN